MVPTINPKLISTLTKLPAATNVKSPLVPDITALLKDKFLLPYPILTQRPRPISNASSKLIVDETHDIFCSAWPKNQDLLKLSTHSLLSTQTYHKALVYYRRCVSCLTHPCASCPLDIATLIGFQTHFEKEVWTSEHVAKFTQLPISLRYKKRILLHDSCNTNGKEDPQYLIVLKDPIPVKRRDLDFNTGNMHLQEQDIIVPKIFKMLKNISENQND